MNRVSQKRFLRQSLVCFAITLLLLLKETIQRTEQLFDVSLFGFLVNTLQVLFFYQGSRKNQTSLIGTRFDAEESLEAAFLRTEELADNLNQQDQIHRVIKRKTVIKRKRRLKPNIAISLVIHRNNETIQSGPARRLWRLLHWYFFDIVQREIHNNPTLLNSQKLKYLKEFLNGDGAKLLSRVLMLNIQSL